MSVLTQNLFLFQHFFIIKLTGSKTSKKIWKTIRDRRSGKNTFCSDTADIFSDLTFLSFNFDPPEI